MQQHAYIIHMKNLTGNIIRLGLPAKTLCMQGTILEIQIWGHHKDSEVQKIEGKEDEKEI